MLCWGSWANTQKLASREWKFQLFYWDYGFGVLIWSLFLAFTFGSIGETGRSFLNDLSQFNVQGEVGALFRNNVLWAFIGGVVFNLSNLLLVIAIDIAGMACSIPNRSWSGSGSGCYLYVLFSARRRPCAHGCRCRFGIGCHHLECYCL